MLLYCDGASRGNPGPAAIGAVLYRKNETEPLTRVSRTIGRATNNIAEYTALREGLTAALAHHPGHLEIRLDSELIVKQIRGEYRVKNANLRPLYEAVRTLLQKFPAWRIRHIPREKNGEADRLANLALDSA